MRDNYLTISEAAARLGITGTLVRRYLRAGRLRGEKFGAAWSLRRKDVDAFRLVPRRPGRPRQK